MSLVFSPVVLLHATVFARTFSIYNNRKCWLLKLATLQNALKSLLKPWSSICSTEKTMYFLSQFVRRRRVDVQRCTLCKRVRCNRWITLPNVRQSAVHLPWSLPVCALYRRVRKRRKLHFRGECTCCTEKTLAHGCNF